MKWYRTQRDTGRDHVGAVYVSEDGRWRIRKEFFADGPSLFVWVVYYDGHWQAEARTLKAAKGWADRWVERYLTGGDPGGDGPMKRLHYRVSDFDVDGTIARASTDGAGD